MRVTLRDLQCRGRWLLAEGVAGAKTPGQGRRQAVFGSERPQPGGSVLVGTGIGPEAAVRPALWCTGRHRVPVPWCTHLGIYFQ